MAKKPRVTLVFNLKKLERDLERELGLTTKQTIESVTPSELKNLGDAIIDEMKAAIAKGISPIKKAGRFPAYKYAADFNEVKKGILQQLKTSESYRGIKGKGAAQRKKSFVDQITKKQTKNIRSRYPFNVQKEFPHKKLRPVNLNLSGDFLDNLVSQVKNKKLRIGFFKDPWMKYESGHREGVNGQPKRPIIPNVGEEFTQSIYRRLVKSLQTIFDNKK